MKKITISFLLLFAVNICAWAQPYADIASFSFQHFEGEYRDSVSGKNNTDDYVLNFFLPKEFKSGHTLLVRLNTESINTNFSSDTLGAYSYRLSSISMPLGVKLVTKNKKFETILIGIPKIASDFRGAIRSEDFQYGGIFLQHWVPNDHFKLKAGLYYNREAFGNFFVPLVGVDWKINDRVYLYGILPTNYRAEFNIVKDRLYMGLNFKSLTRSFRLSAARNSDYVRYNELQTKFFVDCFVVPKVLVFAEVGYTLEALGGQNPLQFTSGTKYETAINPIYTPMSPYLIFNIGVAYRVRLDLQKKEVKSE